MANVRHPSALDWRSPLAVLEPVSGRPGTVALLSDGVGESGRYSYIAVDPVEVLQVEGRDPGLPLEQLQALQQRADSSADEQWIFGLAAYELGHRFESMDLGVDPLWPLLWAGRYESVLRFDHHERRIEVLGPLSCLLAEVFNLPPAARDSSRFAGALSGPVIYPAPHIYETAVTDTVSRIVAGEIFQANLARSWRGRLLSGCVPFDVLARLVTSSPAPYAAFLALDGLALVSNSPEQFLKVSGRQVVTRPVKGTRARAPNEREDDVLLQALQTSEKDRAENLMIVDLMRNDLSRHCQPGTVKAPHLFAVESFSNVHHLVSTVTGVLAQGSGALDLFAACLPPGSITGAPKVQAMKVIADHERPRGPYCGSLFKIGPREELDSSVLIRTLALVQDEGGWSWEVRAGAGVVADSDPHAERVETDTKVSAILTALTGEPCHDPAG